MVARLATSLAILRGEFDTLAPQRSRASDGWIGDPAHAARISRHNPNQFGVVTALDITHDPPGGCDVHNVAGWLLSHPHPELAYIISDGRIGTPGGGWRSYGGSNPHTRHAHFGVGVGPDSDPLPPYDSTTPWGLIKEDDVVNATSQRQHIRGWQHLINRALSNRNIEWPRLVVDGLYGPRTAAAWNKVLLSANIVPHVDLQLGDMIVLGGYGVPIDTD